MNLCVVRAGDLTIYCLSWLIGIDELLIIQVVSGRDVGRCLARVEITFKV